MAKQTMRCVFSDKLCKECALFRGRHYYLCFSRNYQGHRNQKKGNGRFVDHASSGDGLSDTAADGERTKDLHRP